MSISLNWYHLSLNEIKKFLTKIYMLLWRVKGLLNTIYPDFDHKPQHEFEKMRIILSSYLENVKFSYINFFKTNVRAICENLLSKYYDTTFSISISFTLWPGSCWILLQTFKVNATKVQTNVFTWSNNIESIELITVTIFVCILL